MENNLQEETQEVENISMKKLHWIFIIAQLIILFVVTVYILKAGNYGLTLFCGIPLSIGLTIGTYTRTFASKKLLKGFFFVLLAVSFFSAFLLAAGVEGAICILMAVGIIFLPAIFGMLIGYAVRNMLRVVSLLLIVVLNTSAFVYDKKTDEFVQSIAKKSMVINASKEKIWYALTNPVSFSKNENVFFKAGVSYPTEMFLQKEANNCLFLNCTYNNGSTKLFIEKLDSLKCMRFIMQEEITTMKELTFHEPIMPAHLKGYFKPVYGEFAIEEINKNQCVVTATTSYSYKIRPAFYWNWWTDYLANAMHTHVLKNIKQLAEN
jgi:hypothetical protein